MWASAPRSGSGTTSASSSATGSRSPSPNARRSCSTTGPRQAPGGRRADRDRVRRSERKMSSPGCRTTCCVAGHCAVDGYANAYLTGLAYRRALVEAGVAVARADPGAGGGAERAAAFCVRTRGGAIRCRRIVLAGGVWIEPMLAWLGVHLPIKVLVNQLAVTERIAPVMRTVIGIASGLLSLKQYPHGTVVIGGGWQGRGRPGARRRRTRSRAPHRQRPPRLPRRPGAGLRARWRGPGPGSKPRPPTRSRRSAPFQAFQALMCAAASIRATRAGPTSRDSSPTGSWAASRRCRSSRSSACSPRPSPSEAPHDGSSSAESSAASTRRLSCR